MFKRSLTLLFIVAFSLTTLTLTPAFAQNDTCKAVATPALKWIATLQNPDGGFTDGFKPESSIGATADTIFAIVSTGGKIVDFKKGDKDPITYLTDQVKAGKVTTAGALAKVIIAVNAAGVDPKTFGGSDLVKQLTEASAKLTDGSDLFSLGLSVIALADVKADISADLVSTITKNRNKDGAWGYAAGKDSDTNTTGVLIEALAAAGKAEDAKPAWDYLHSVQNKDGGWPFQKASPAAESDSNSTAGVLDALIASGQKITDWNKPDAALAAYAQKDGSFTYQLSQPADSLLSTVAAVPALCEIVPVPASK